LTLLPFCLLLPEMSAHSRDIEISVTPAVKDLRSMFEQKSRQASPVIPTASLRPEDSLLFGSRPSISRRSSPTPLLDSQTESLTLQPSPTPPEQSSLRKRPPPPPPSRGPKPQIGSPSPSTSPRLRATLEQGNLPESRSPPSVKQRLATRLPPPVPDLRLDRTSDVELNSNTKSSVDTPPTRLE
jgi:hypothetical protein